MICFTLAQGLFGEREEAVDTFDKRAIKHTGATINHLVFRRLVFCLVALVYFGLAVQAADGRK